MSREYGIRDIIRKNIFLKVLKVVFEGMAYFKWIIQGKPFPLPYPLKHRIIKEYSKKFSLGIFIETGTCSGDTVWSVKSSFKEVYSIELDNMLFARAREKFNGRDNIMILNGDSAKILPGLLSGITESCLFWLDGHYSGGITAKGDKNTPIFEELSAILKHNVKRHVILIDDARLFNGNSDWPKLEALLDFIRRSSPNSKIEIKEDIIRVEPLNNL